MYIDMVCLNFGHSMYARSNVRMYTHIYKHSNMYKYVYVHFSVSPSRAVFFDNYVYTHICIYPHMHVLHPIQYSEHAPTWCV